MKYFLKAFAVATAVSAVIAFQATTNAQFFDSDIDDILSSENVDRVTGVTAAADEGSVALVWNAKTDLNGDAPQNYRINYGTESENLNDTKETMDDLQAAVVEDLQVGTRYYFTVTALYKDGSESQASAEVSATPKASEETKANNAPQVTEAVAVSTLEVRVIFNEAVELPAQNPYRAFFITEKSNTSKELASLDARYGTNPYTGQPIRTEVLVTTAEQVKDVEYQVTVSAQVTDEDGNPMQSGATDSAVFSGFGTDMPDGEVSLDGVDAEGVSSEDSNSEASEELHNSPQNPNNFLAPNDPVDEQEASDTTAEDSETTTPLDDTETTSEASEGVTQVDTPETDKPTAFTDVFPATIGDWARGDISTAGDIMKPTFAKIMYSKDGNDLTVTLKQSSELETEDFDFAESSSVKIAEVAMAKQQQKDIEKHLWFINLPDDHLDTLLVSANTSQDTDQVLKALIDLFSINDAKLAEKVTSSIEAVTPDTIAPEDVTNFVSQTQARANDWLVKLSWTPSINSAADLTDQILYRQLGAGQWTNESLGSTVASADRVEKPNTEVTYKLTVKDETGNESTGAIRTVKLGTLPDNLPETGAPLAFMVGAALTVAGVRRMRQK